MVLLSCPEYGTILRDARRGSAPKSINERETLVNRNLAFKLFQQLEQVKILLSTEATASGCFALRRNLLNARLHPLVYPKLWLRQPAPTITPLFDFSPLKTFRLPQPTRMN